MIWSHEENIDDICVLESNKLLVSCSGIEEVIKVWDEATKTQLYEFLSQGDWPWKLAAHPTQPVFAAGY